jgi:hypothetical protein
MSGFVEGKLVFGVFSVDIEHKLPEVPLGRKATYLGHLPPFISLGQV